MQNQLNLDQKFVNDVAESLNAAGVKEVKGKVKMGVWIVRQNAKHTDLEEHLESEIYEYDVTNQNGIVIRKSCVFIAIDTRDNTVLFANLLTHKFGLKLRKELQIKREAKERQLRYVSA